MGWLRSVGSSKSQVSFAEYSLSHRALLQKRPNFLRSLPHTYRPTTDRLTHTYIHIVYHIGKTLDFAGGLTSSRVHTHAHTHTHTHRLTDRPTHTYTCRITHIHIVQQAPYNYRSLLQNIISLIGLFCKRDLKFEGAY